MASVETDGFKLSLAAYRKAMVLAVFVGRHQSQGDNKMKTSRESYKVVFTASCLFIPLALLAQDQELSLKHGTYAATGTPCKDAPLAAVRGWDGVGFSGPHSSRCTTRVLTQRAQQFNVSTTCKAIGDGTPLPAGQVDVQVVSLLRLSNARFKISDATDPQGVTYRWCSIDRGLPNFPK